MLRTIKLLLTACILVAAPGCKLAVVVVEGGDVITPNGTGTRQCLEGNVCIFESTAPDLNETFTADPKPGWRFVRWNSGGNMQCPDQAAPDCVLNNTLLAGNAAAEAFIASDKTFYLMPVFENDPDTVFAEGKLWLQPDLFLNLSWNDINAVCPSGLCADGGTLNGHDMSGWTWASLDEIGSFFSALTPFPGGFGRYDEANSTWAPSFYDGIGFRPSVDIEDRRIIEGLVSTANMAAATPYSYIAQVQDWLDSIHDDSVSTTLVVGLDQSRPAAGAWFYRTP